MKGQVPGSRILSLTAALTVWLLTMGLVTQSSPASAMDGEFLFRDGFSTTDYNGNDGPDKFAGPWFEFADRGGADEGMVTVSREEDCPRDQCARISAENQTLSGTGLARWADIDDAATAKIRVKYRFDVDETTTGFLGIAAFDGTAWHTVAEIRPDHDDRRIRTKIYKVVEFADAEFAVGFFAHGRWDGDIFIDDVQLFGSWQSSPTTTSTTTSVPPTAAPTTTGPSPTSAPPATSTTLAPPTTSQPPSGSAATTTAPATSIATPPPTNGPSTTAPPITEPPFIDDERYRGKSELANRIIFVEALMEMPTQTSRIPAPGPVTQIMASVTTTAVTMRSHLLPTMILGLLIAVGAIWGLGRRQPSLSSSPE